MEKTIVVLCTLDTKWKEIEFLKNVILKRGHKVTILDVSLGRDAPLSGDISPAEIPTAAGSDIATMRKHAPKARGEASQIMTKGSIVKAKELFEAGKLDGLISIGGNSNTAMATDVMKSLPFGVSKFMVSSAASMPAYAAEFIGTSDITMMHSVVDISGTNDLNLDVLTRAGGAISGMVETGGAILAKAGKKAGKTVDCAYSIQFLRNSRKDRHEIS